METEWNVLKHAVLRLSLNRENTWGGPSANHSSDKSLQYYSQLQKGGTFLTQTPTMKAIPRQMILWVYRDPSELHLLPLDSKKSPTVKLKEFVDKHYRLEEESYTLAILVPGVAYPVPVTRTSVDFEKGVVLCMPTLGTTLNIQAPSGEKFHINMNPLKTIKDLKRHIEKHAGYPHNVQELVYNNHALQNRLLIIDYAIPEGAKLHLKLQPAMAFPIVVETFWGKSYKIEVTPCFTAEDILTKIIKKTFNKPALFDSVLPHLSAMYNSCMILDFNKTMLDRLSCINRFEIDKGDILSIVSISDMRGENVRELSVKQDFGDPLLVQCSSYDTWLMIALQLHGTTEIPIDTMQILQDERPIDLQGIVSAIKADETQLPVSLTTLESSPLVTNDKVTLDIKTVSGLVQEVQCSLKDSVKDVKLVLEEAGVEDAPVYDILYKRVRLPNASKLSDYKLVERVRMALRLSEFPVTVVHGTSIQKITATSDGILADFLQRVESKAHCPPMKFCIVHAGEDLYNYDTLMVGETYLNIHSKLYVEQLQNNKVLHLITEKESIPIPTKSNMDSMHVRQLQSVHNDIESLINSLKWFVKWRFPDKSKIFSQLRHNDLAKQKSYTKRTHQFSSASIESVQSLPVQGTNYFPSKPPSRGSTCTSARSSSSYSRSVQPFTPRSHVIPEQNMMMTPRTPHSSHSLPIILSSHPSYKGSPVSIHKSAIQSRTTFRSMSSPRVTVPRDYSLSGKSGSDPSCSSSKKKLSVRFEIPEPSTPRQDRGRPRYSMNQVLNGDARARSADGVRENGNEYNRPVSLMNKPALKQTPLLATE